MIRAQLFVNYYVLTHADQTIDKRAFMQNFWYCMTQLVSSKSPKNTKALPSDILDCWNSFSSRYRVIYSMEEVVSGYSQCVTAACVEMSSMYTNSAVECFEESLLSYLLISVKELFEKVITVFHKHRLQFLRNLTIYLYIFS